jgi:hypothetical protein
MRVPPGIIVLRVASEYSVQYSGNIEFGVIVQESKQLCKLRKVIP